MKKFKNWYFPDTEEYFIKLIKKIETDKVQYQEKQRLESFKFLDNSRVAIDIGANIGLWAKDICNKFEKVYLFEPYHENVLCLKENLINFDNFEIYQKALSNENKISEFFVNEKNLGASSFLVSENLDCLKKINVEKIKLDDLNLFEVDYIKIDVQFHELEVLQGSINTLKNNNPVLCIEAARRNDEELSYVKKFVNLLENLGYIIVGQSVKELFFKR